MIYNSLQVRNGRVFDKWCIKRAEMKPVEEDKPKSELSLIEYAQILPLEIKRRTPISIIPRQIYRKCKRCNKCLVKSLCIYDPDKEYKFIASVRPCKKLTDTCSELTTVNFEVIK